MPQIFSQRAQLVVKLAIAGVALAVIALVGAFRWTMAESSDNHAILAQPIPFSHKHHVSDDGIDCRYCHTTVEKSSSAGMPSTQICLSCHSQLYTDAPVLAALHQSEASGQPVAWQRVHDLPDFVYFNHGIHVAKGVACSECHGRVDQMPMMWREASLDMQWCLACHRDPAPHLHPPQEAFKMQHDALTPAEQVALMHVMHIEDTARLTDCSTCHR